MVNVHKKPGLQGTKSKAATAKLKISRITMTEVKKMCLDSYFRHWLNRTFLLVIMLDNEIQIHRNTDSLCSDIMSTKPVTASRIFKTTA